MENQEKINLPYDLFKKTSTELSSLPHSYFIGNDDIVNDIVNKLSSSSKTEEINTLLQPLIDNFIQIRMNAAIFTKSSSKDIFQILFDLYLRFDNDETPPPETIITLFHILLYYGSNETNAFNWVFNTISTKIRNNTLTASVLLNFITLTKEIYKMKGPTNDSFQQENNSKYSIPLSSYFYFYPGSSSLKLDLKTNKELDLNKGLGFSLWIKFPFLKHNLAIFNQENVIDLEMELIKIEFYNNQVPPIIIKLGFVKGDTKTSILSLIGFNTTQSVYLSLNDILMHLHFVINLKSQQLELFINGSLMTQIKMNKFTMKQITLIELFKNFVGEVRCIVLYSQLDNKNLQWSQLGRLNSFVQFYQELTEPDNNGKYPLNIALAYLPYAQGENIYNSYENNSAYSFQFRDQLSSVYNHCSSKDQIRKWFNANTYLPIFEYLYKNRHSQSFDILNESIVIQLLEIIVETYIYDCDNKMLSSDNFFFILSMFLEKMPSSLFTVALGKKISNMSFELKTLNCKNNHKRFIYNILLNDKIMYKYHKSFTIWKEILSSSIADETISSLCTMKELINALIYFDNNRFTQSCCGYHKEAFFCEQNNLGSTIMEPILTERIKEVVDLIQTKIRYQSNRQDINTDSIEANEARKEAQKKLSKLFHFNFSPCLVIRLLTLLRKCEMTDEVFYNCLLTLNSPLLDVRNACLEFMLCWIGKSIFNKSSYINIGLILKKYFLTCLAPNKYDKDVQISKEYIDNSIKSTKLILMKWIVFNNSESKNKLIPNAEILIKPFGTDNNEIDVNSNNNNGHEDNNNNNTYNQLDEIRNGLKNLIMEFQTLLKKLMVFEPFFQEVIDIITETVTQLNQEEKNKVKSMIDQNIFQTKFSIVFGSLKANCPFQLFYIKILFIYYYLTTDDTSVRKMRTQLVTDISWFTSAMIEDKDVWLDKEKLKERIFSIGAKSLTNFNPKLNQAHNNNNKINDEKQSFADILIERTIQYLKNNNNVHEYNAQHSDLINMILSSFNYYITNYKPGAYQREDIYKHLNLNEINSKSGIVFFDDVFEYYQCVWDKDLYRISNLLIALSKANKQKATMNGLQFINGLTNEQQIFTQTLGDPQYTYSLVMIICFIFISRITKSKNEETVKLVNKFKDYLIFVIIVSIITVKRSPTGKEANQSNRRNNSFFYEVIASGLELILTLEKEYKNTPYPIQDVSSEILYCIFYFYESNPIGNKNAFESLFHNSQNANLNKPVFIEIITQMKEDKSNKDLFSDMLSKIKKEKGKVDPKNVQFPFLLKTLFNVSLKERLKSTMSIIKEFILLSAQSDSCASKKMQSESEMKNAKKELLEQFKKEVSVELTRNYVDEKFKRKKYKQIKKELFLWNRPWSNKGVFYKNEDMPLEDFEDIDFSHYPKSKMLNHYSKSFTKPFLVPIIDMTYHLPDFEKYKREELFNKGDVNGADDVCINVDKIIDEDYINNGSGSGSNNDKQIESENKVNKIDKEKEVIKLNALYYSYNISIEPDILYNFALSIKNDETTTKPSKETCELLTLKRKNANETNICCLVKLSRHIKGKFKLNQRSKFFEFKPLINRTIYSDPEEEKKDIDFDLVKQTCFGSYVNKYPKDNNKVYYHFNCNTITHIFQKRYLYRNTGLEIYTKSNKSYYFNFLNEKTRNDVFQILKSYVKDKGNAFDYDSKSNSYFNQWRSSKISTMHFLEMINVQANRSYNDISQYPVFPWVYTNYSIEAIPNDEQDYRNFSLPIGMMELERYPKSCERKMSYIDNYQSLKYDADNEEGNNEDTNLIQPYFFGSHYSNPMYVTQFLSRLFPMGETLIELQGNKFDDPNRLFLSVESTFEGVVSLKGDVRELIPQFFYLPEFFLNVNNFDMGITRNMKKVHNAKCPLWSQCSPFNFVLQMRKFLEGDYVSANLHSWIDLIFGYKQQGEEALKAQNVFMSQSYINQVTIDEQASKDKQEYIFRLSEFGLTPKQILTSPCEQKQIKTDDSNKSLAQIVSLRKENISHKYIAIEYYSKALIPLHLSKIKCISHDKLLFYYSNGRIEAVKYHLINKMSELMKSKHQFGHKLLSSSDSSPKIASVSNKIGSYYESNQLPIVTLDDGATILQGGLYDGSILVSHNDKGIEKIKAPNEVYKSPICIIISTKEENIIIAGTQCGLIHIYQRADENNNQIVHKKTLNAHQSTINHLYISHELNAFASAAEDNYVHIHAMITYKMIRSLKVDQCKKVFLSDSPLPSIIVYSSFNSRFLCYSLNGFLMKYVPEEDMPIDPRVIKSSLFFDYLIYATIKQTIIIRAFPYLDIVYSVSLTVDINAFGSCFYDMTQDMKSIIVYSVKGKTLYVIKDFGNLAID